MKKRHLLFLTSLAATSIVAQQKPNIVFIIADDCRRLDLGCYGSPDAITPNIDKLAQEGLNFNKFFQATAMSSPTRHCLLPGLYPVKSGAYPNHTFIKDGIKTLPYYLNEAGYRVAHQGKRHIAPLESFPFQYLDDNKVKKGNHDIIIDHVEPFIAEVAKSKEPFFLYLASTEPHSPWTKGDHSLFDPDKITLPPNLVDTKETRRQYANYLAEINYMDNHIGKVDALIEKYGLADNTIFIFTSEQGYSFPFAKWTCYDAGLQTGFIVRWKGVIKPGSQTDAMCEYVDVTPTLIDIAGGRVPKDVDGKSFLPVIKGKKDKFKEYAYGIQTSRGIFSGPEYYGVRSVRNDKYSYIVNLTPDAEFKCTSAIKRDKVWNSWLQRAETDDFARQQTTLFKKRPAEELYDVVNDPFQMRNLASDPQYAKIIKTMRGKLEKWMKGQGDKGQETEMQAKEHQLH